MEAARRMSIRPHAYVRDDRPAAWEWGDNRRCAVCQMPKQHLAHNVDTEALAEETAALRDRMLGERQREEDA